MLNTPFVVLCASLSLLGLCFRSHWVQFENQVEALRIDTEARLQAQENGARRFSRELTVTVTEQRRSVEDAVHDIGTRGEIARGHMREALREELEAIRLNGQSGQNTQALFSATRVSVEIVCWEPLF
jgi:hypothetical protein